MLISLLLAAAVSDASAGPDLAERAVAVELPVERVWVFSDRARVRRAGRAKVPAGLATIRLPDLPGATLLDTLRVSADGARVVRVETHRVQRERWSIDQVDAWLVELEKVGDQIALTQGRLAAVDHELTLLSSLDAADPVPEKDRAGKPVPPLAPNELRALQDRLGTRRAKARANQRVLESELKKQFAAYKKAQREVQARDLGAFTDNKVEVLAILEAARADPNVSVEYAIGGAYWKPAYELSFDPDAQSVELRASALVSQATGEDWPGARLSFSTAIPGSGIDLPELLTWTLGDDREYVPRATARAWPRPPQRFQAPAARPRIAELEREADRALLGQHTSQLLALASSAPAQQDPFGPRTLPASTGRARADRDEPELQEGEQTIDENGETVTYRRKTAINFEDVEIEGDLKTPDASYLRSGLNVGSGAGYGTSAVPPPAPAAMAAPADDGFSFDAELDADRAEMHTSSLESVTRSRPSSARPAATGKRLAMRAGLQWQRQTFSDPLLPAVTAGGFDYVYDAPVPASVPSQANGLRVPLASRKYTVTTFYEATPSLAKTAYLKASVKNGSALPILAGPANVFVKGTFTGDAVLATTGPGGTLELPLGADENIRLTRTVVPATSTEGLIMKDDVTDYAVKIEIGNYKKRAVTLRVIDQVPKTNEEKIDVKLVSSSPRVEKQPDGDGVVYWHIELPANGTKTITFTYRITRPKGWRLSQ